MKIYLWPKALIAGDNIKKNNFDVHERKKQRIV
jgi:hypothetical protein